MPRGIMGQINQLTSGGLEYFTLKSKGEKLTLRFISLEYAYDGKHFIDDGGAKKKVVFCPRIMDEDKNAHCDYCEKFFAYAKDLKEQKDLLTKEQIKELEDKKKDNRVVTSLYYPVVNRSNGVVGVFKTTTSMMLKLDAEVKLGINVLDYDYVVERTEQSGAGYYSLTRLPDKQCAPLSDEETLDAQEFMTIHIEDRLNAQRTSRTLDSDMKQVIEEAEPTESEKLKMDENISPDDIPF